MEIKRSLIIRNINLNPPSLARSECCNISNFHNQVIIVIKYHIHYQSYFRPDGLCNPIPWLKPLNRELSFCHSPPLSRLGATAWLCRAGQCFIPENLPKVGSWQRPICRGCFLLGQWHGHALAASERWRRFNDRQEFLSFSSDVNCSQSVSQSVSHHYSDIQSDW